MKLPYMDIVIQGEGELILPQVIGRLTTNESLDSLPGVWFRAKGSYNVLNGGPPKLIEDLDSLPFPAWDLFNLPNLFSYRPGEMTVITSRGCPYSCAFCSIERVMGRKYRPRSPENVLAELSLLVTRYGVRTIFIEDDNFTLDRDRTVQILESLLQKNLQITWFPRNGVRLDTLDRPLIQLMKQSGCGRLWLAPESGSERILKEVINKKLDMSRVYKVAKDAVDIGLSVTCFFVIGFPQETKSDLEATIQMALELRKMGVDDFWFSCAIPYIGTRLHDMYTEINPQVNWGDMASGFSTHEGILDTVDFTSDQIRLLREGAMKYLNDHSRPDVTLEDIFGYITRTNLPK